MFWCRKFAEEWLYSEHCEPSCFNSNRTWFLWKHWTALQIHPLWSLQNIWILAVFLFNCTDSFPRLWLTKNIYMARWVTLNHAMTRIQKHKTLSYSYVMWHELFSEHVLTVNKMCGNIQDVHFPVSLNMVAVSHRRSAFTGNLEQSGKLNCRAKVNSKTCRLPTWQSSCDSCQRTMLCSSPQNLTTCSAATWLTYPPHTCSTHYHHGR